MKLRSSLRALACVAAACGTVLAAQAAPAYHLVDLGTDATAYAINNHGTIAGTWPGAVAATWHDGAWHQRKPGVRADNIDDDGELVGLAQFIPGGIARPAYWPKVGAAIQVVTPYGPRSTAVYSVAAGRVSGAGVGADGIQNCFTWTPAGGVVEFAAGSSLGWCAATGINEAGQVAGTSVQAGSAHENAFIWQDGVMTFLPMLPGATDSYGNAINGKGHVIIQSNQPTASGGNWTRSTLWNGRRLIDIGVLYKGASSEPKAMNDHDDVVGETFDHQGLHSSSYLYSDGQLYDLATLIDNGVGWEFPFGASGIADDGTIVGNAKLGDLWHAYMLVPLTPLH